MGVLLLTSGDELLLQDGVDAILLHLPEPGCLLLTLTTPEVVISISGPSVTMGMTGPTVSIAMEEC